MKKIPRILVFATLLALMFNMAACDNPTSSEAGAPKAITSFSFEELTPPVEGTINNQLRSIVLVVPDSTVKTSLVPTITHTGKSISPESGAAQDFTDSVSYTVTATDDSTAVYTVTVYEESEVPGFIIDDLGGQWLGTFTSPLDGPNGAFDALLMEFDGDEFTILFFYEDEQSDGLKGSCSIIMDAGQETLDIQFSEIWDTDEWVEYTGTDDWAVDLIGDQLSLTVNETMNLERITTSNPEDYNGKWSHVDLNEYDELEYITNIVFNTIDDSYSWKEGPVTNDSGYVWHIEYMYEGSWSQLGSDYFLIHTDSYTDYTGTTPVTHNNLSMYSLYEFDYVPGNAAQEPPDRIDLFVGAEEYNFYKQAESQD